jgi:phytoene desaturase
MKNRVVIIGAGLGGLSAAAYLAKVGYEVTILEKNQHIGGRAQVWKKNGFTFDLGPTWYWMPEVLQSFFDDFEYKQDDLYKLVRLDPSYRAYFKDGFIDIPTEVTKTAQLFESIEKNSGKKLQKVINQTKKVYKLAMRSFVTPPFESVIEFFKPKQIIDGIKLLGSINVLQSADKYIKGNFKNEKLIKLMSFPIFFLGESTKNIPSVYCMMNCADLVGGTWYPIGGFGKVAEAVGKVATDLGVKILNNTEVTKIEIREKKAVGVATAEGKFFPADIVISNGDYHHNDRKMVDSKYAQYSENRWDKMKLAPSALLIHMGLNKKVTGLPHHSLFFNNDWNAHNEALFDKPKWPDKPLFYVSIPTKTDPKLAPEGKEQMTILIPLAAGLTPNKKAQKKIIDTVIDDLSRISGQNINQAIEFMRVYNPDDFVNDYMAYKGNAYGLGQTVLQTAIFRPRLNSSKVRNLYYTGQFTKPGIGVPMVIISGKIVAQLITGKYGK